ncbi:unnamed protein product [Symbiodinium pilosum]|uniref:Uncharacterized protein n=1 Tax=Symbiodinium pilosum TaxID=2952 RepID=A0A812QD79_SYMPI|nr:unnamed protein product [Symbiodinium pilosum]
MVDIIPTAGLGLSFTETTLGGSAASVKQDVSFGRLLLSCSGPANDKGEEAAVKLEIGSNVQWRLTQVNLQAGGRSLLRIGGPVYLGSMLSISGPEGIVQLENASVASLVVNLGGGYLHLHDVDFDTARFTLADTSLYLHAADSMPSFDLTVRSVSDGVDDDLLVQSEAKADLCMSSASGVPQAGNVTLLKKGTAQQTYRFGNGPSYRSVSVTRDVKAADNRLFVSHGVVRSERSCNNTLDTLKGQQVVQLGPGFQNWAQMMADQQIETLRLHVVGPALGNFLQDMNSRGSWIYSRYGTTMMWFPLLLFPVFTAGIYAPETVRHAALINSGLCLTEEQRLLVQTSDCADQEPTAQSLRVMALEDSLKALLQSLPSALLAPTVPNSQVLYIEGKQENKTEVFFPSFADGVVETFSLTRGKYVRQVQNNPSFLRGLLGLLFLIAIFFLAIMGAVFGSQVFFMIYHLEKGRFRRVKSRLLHKKSRDAEKTDTVQVHEGAEEAQKVLEMEAQSAGALSILEYLFFRVPAGFKDLGSMDLCKLVMVQFVAMQLLVLPFAAAAYHHWLYEEEMAKQLCSFTDYLHGECFVVNPGLSSGLLIAAIIMDVLLLINTLFEYVLRTEQVRWVTGAAPARGRHLALLKVGNSWIYVLLICSSMVLGVALCLSYVLLVLLFVALSALLKPAVMAPVLAMLASACCVSQLVTVQMKQVVVKAKAWVQDLVHKSKEELIELEKEFADVPDESATKDDEKPDHGEADANISQDLKDIEDHLLVLLGLSRGQLLLLQVEAVLVFLGVGAFLLVGVMLFLGPDAWIAQLSANAATLGAAIAAIQSQVGKVKDRDFAKMQKILEEAAAGLKKDKKKTQ